MPKRISIASARKRAGYTQKELSEKIQKSFSSVQKYELGIVSPDFDTLVTIARACKVDPYLFISDYVEELIDEAEFAPPQGFLSRNALETEIAVLNTNLQRLHPMQQSTSNNSRQQFLLDAFAQLNNEGQDVAIDRVKELTEIERYRKPADQDPK